MDTMGHPPDIYIPSRKKRYAHLSHSIWNPQWILILDEPSEEDESVKWVLHHLPTTAFVMSATSWQLVNQEVKELNDLNSEDLRCAALQSWVSKEAAIKWQRESLATNISKWNFSKDSNLMVHQSLGYKIGLHRVQLNSWYMAVAYDQNIHLHTPLICLN